jgi:hypothetical protein
MQPPWTAGHSPGRNSALLVLWAAADLFFVHPEQILSLSNSPFALTKLPVHTKFNKSSPPVH